MSAPFPILSDDSGIKAKTNDAASEYAGWEAVIGLEVHAQISANHKLFSRSNASFDHAPNCDANLIDIGAPGMLPVLNYFCIEQAVKTVLGLSGDVSLVSIFDRKNYSYPDLPKGYQITQYYHPIGLHCTLEIEINGEQRKILIERIHVEEDAGKTIHHTNGQTFIDFNRAGIGLMEIVTAPVMHSSSECIAFLRKLRVILRALGTCDGEMQNGSMRCDANVSVRRVDDDKLGVRSEIKNLNSITNVGRAIDYEIIRHIRVLEEGGVLFQDTRSFDVDTGTTKLLRSKEDVTDYCYFPDPDLPAVRLTPEFVEKVRNSLPELPDAKKNRYIKDHDLTPIDAEILAFDNHTALYFEEALKHRSALDGTSASRLIANWIIVELFSYIKEHAISISESPVSPRYLAELIDLISQNVISGKIAKKVFEKMCLESTAPSVIVERDRLHQVVNEGEITLFIRNVLAVYPNEVARYKAGAHKLLGFFVGEVMKKSDGKVNPELCRKFIQEALL